MLGLDLFDKVGTLARYWDAITGAFALDALTVGEAAAPVAGGDLVAEVEAFLRFTLAADGPRLGGVGEGDEIHLRAEAVDGQALVWDDAVIHLAAFPA